MQIAPRFVRKPFLLLCSGHCLQYLANSQVFTYRNWPNFHILRSPCLNFELFKLRFRNPG
jgi:hypothetical protein